MSKYILLAFFWVLVCVSIGLYINGIGMKEKSHYKVGFVTIGISYFIGICLLLAIIILYQ